MSVQEQLGAGPRPQVWQKLSVDQWFMVGLIRERGADSSLIARMGDPARPFYVGSAKLLKAPPYPRDLAIRRLPPPGSLVVTGGATLFRLVRRLGAGALLVSGEVMPGVARSRLEGGRWSGATVISKSGAFGTPDLLVRWWGRAQT